MECVNCKHPANAFFLGSEEIKTRFQGQRLKQDCLYTSMMWKFHFFSYGLYSASISVCNNYMSREMKYVIHPFTSFSCYTSRMDLRRTLCRYLNTQLMYLILDLLVVSSQAVFGSSENYSGINQEGVCAREWIKPIIRSPSCCFAKDCVDCDLFLGL